jgi:hypothetical protein
MHGVEEDRKHLSRLDQLWGPNQPVGTWAVEELKPLVQFISTLRSI